MKRNQYIIRSKERPGHAGYFVAVHSFTPFFSHRGIARRFASKEMATAYARTELFTKDAAFEIVEVPEIDLDQLGAQAMEDACGING